jgi:hypothetical protein
VEMPGRGKRGKPKNGFPPFPPPLEIPPQRRDSHIPTATAAVYILTGRQKKPYPTYNVPRWAKLNRRKWAKRSCQTHPNYGERYRQGETISTAFVESTINQVVSRRFVKKQQMHWTLRGAHLLLQTRTKVLNSELEDAFQRWYPLFRAQAKAA